MNLMNRFYSLLVLLLVGSASLLAQDDPFPDASTAAAKYDSNMCIIARVMMNGEAVTDATVAAYCGDEFRGKQIAGADPKDPTLVFLMAYGGYTGKKQYMHFRVYTNGRIYIYNSDPDLVYFMDTMLGKVSSPYIIDITPVNLADNGDNTDVLTTQNGENRNVFLTGRTLYRDGDWNTLCPPFDVTLDGSELQGATARPLTNASISGSTLNLTFGEPVDMLKAGTPYIIKWEASETDIVKPFFAGVTIDATDRSFDNEADDDTRVRFVGTYQTKMFDANDYSVLMLGAQNKLYYPSRGAGIGAQRAYFKLGGDETQMSRLTSFIMDFSDGETTGIISISSPIHPEGGCYTLDGRKLSQKPATRGVYIVNGKKIIIK